MKLSKNLPSRRRDTLCGQTDRRTGHEANSPFRKFANAPLKCCTGKKDLSLFSDPYKTAKQTVRAESNISGR